MRQYVLGYEVVATGLDGFACSWAAYDLAAGRLWGSGSATTFAACLLDATGRIEEAIFGRR